MAEQWMDELTGKIRNIVGDEKAVHYQMNIIPRIVMDFYRMLRESEAGRQVSEDYQMEDGSMRISLTGEKDRKGNCKVNRVDVKKNT